MKADGETYTKNEAWETFKKSGKVSDYLIYNSIGGNEHYGTDKDKGNSNSADAVWGK